MDKLARRLARTPKLPKNYPFICHLVQNIYEYRGKTNLPFSLYRYPPSW